MIFSLQYLIKYHTEPIVIPANSKLAISFSGILCPTDFLMIEIIYDHRMPLQDSAIRHFIIHKGTIILLSHFLSFYFKCFIAAIRCSMLEAESISFLKFSSSVLIDHETVTRPSFFNRSISRTTRSDFVQIRISASLPISCSRSFLVFPNCSSCGL